MTIKSTHINTFLKRKSIKFTMRCSTTIKVSNYVCIHLFLSVFIYIMGKSEDCGWIALALILNHRLVILNSSEFQDTIIFNVGYKIYCYCAHGLSNKILWINIKFVCYVLYSYIYIYICKKTIIILLIDFIFDLFQNNLKA